MQVNKFVYPIEKIKLLLDDTSGRIDNSELLDKFSDVTFFVGTNAKSNWYLYDIIQDYYTIFHLDSFSSPYVILSLPIDQLEPQLIYIAASLCKKLTKYKYVPNIVVMYTSKSNTVKGKSIGSFNIVSKKKKRVIKI